MMPDEAWIGSQSRDDAMRKMLQVTGKVFGRTCVDDTCVVLDGVAYIVPKNPEHGRIVKHGYFHQFIKDVLDGKFAEFQYVNEQGGFHVLPLLKSSTAD